MPRICYVEKRFSGSSKRMIENANAIIAEYEGSGINLTLRSLYYQFVSRGLLANKQSEYKRLGSVINDARLAGLIDWNSLEDRTRNLQSLGFWDSPEEMIQTYGQYFRYDLWADQANRVEVWIEKDALVGVIEGVCQELRVPFFSCRGYTSQSEMWSAAMRLKAYEKQGQTPYILHLGDHDPSGIDMTRDITERMEMFMGGIDINRLALNMPQVERYNPPPNPAKVTDSRFRDYEREHGDESWELDALEPTVIVKLIRQAVLKLRDEKKWLAQVAREKETRQGLAKVADNWNNVQEYLEDF